MTSETSAAPLLEIRDLSVAFEVDDGEVQALDGVNLEMAPGKTLGLVGESGCGKSETALSIMRLLPKPMGKILSGSSITFDGRDLLQLSPDEMRRVRGNDVGMIFQEPMTALNPVKKIGAQLGEVFRLHQDVDEATALEQSVDMLDKVGIPSPETRVFEYPHQLSGGMRGRGHRHGLICEPRLVIADEPTTALDATVQPNLDLFSQLQRDRFRRTTHHPRPRCNCRNLRRGLRHTRRSHCGAARRGTVPQPSPCLHPRPAQIHSAHRRDAKLARCH